MAISVNAPEIDAYVEAHTTPHPPFMRELAEATRRHLSTPAMLTGLVEGRLLEMLVYASGARRVLEVGTYSGYSALSMAAALPDDGQIVTCELSEEHAAFARRHVDASPYAGRIDIRVGPAADTIRSLAGPFDLVFVDADKPGYPEYVELALPLLSERGLIVVDNTLWGGRVLPGRDDGQESTAALRRLNDALVADERLVCVQLPVRDGITLVRPARPAQTNRSGARSSSAASP